MLLETDSTSTSYIAPAIELSGGSGARAGCDAGDEFAPPAPDAPVNSALAPCA
jgi:hypothetical protein